MRFRVYVHKYVYLYLVEFKIYFLDIVIAFSFLSDEQRWILNFRKQSGDKNRI